VQIVPGSDYSKSLISWAPRHCVATIGMTLSIMTFGIMKLSMTFDITTLSVMTFGNRYKATLSITAECCYAEYPKNAYTASVAAPFLTPLALKDV